MANCWPSGTQQQTRGGLLALRTSRERSGAFRQKREQLRLRRGQGLPKPCTTRAMMAQISSPSACLIQSTGWSNTLCRARQATIMAAYEYEPLTAHTATAK